MAGRDRRRHQHPTVVDSTAAREAPPVRLDVTFTDWRTVDGLDTTALHEALRGVNYGDATHNPQLMAAACAVRGFLGMHRASNDGRWVCVIFRTAHEYRVMVAIPVVRNVLPVVCTQGADNDTARSFLDDFTTALA